MRNDPEVLDDRGEHETTYDLFKVNNAGLSNLESAIAQAQALLSGAWRTTPVDEVTIRRVRVRQTIQIVEEGNEGE